MDWHWNSTRPDIHSIHTPFHLSYQHIIHCKFLFNKRTECEPSQFGSNSEHIAAALAPYRRNAAAAANNVKQAASDVVVEDTQDTIFGWALR